MHIYYVSVRIIVNFIDTIMECMHINYVSVRNVIAVINIVTMLLVVKNNEFPFNNIVKWIMHACQYYLFDGALHS